MQGRRRPDLWLGEIHDDLQPGDYWKILDGEGKPRHSDHPENLTGTCWFIVVPLGDGYGIGRLEKHTVREHEDGTISVRPNDGSSNSIKVSKASGVEWHGYIEHDIWREV